MNHLGKFNKSGACRMSVSRLVVLRIFKLHICEYMLSLSHDGGKGIPVNVYTDGGDVIAALLLFDLHR